MAIESSGCAYVYISDDMGGWWGVGGFGEGSWDEGCGVSGWWWVNPLHNFRFEDINAGIHQIIGKGLIRIRFFNEALHLLAGV